MIDTIAEEVRRFGRSRVMVLASRRLDAVAAAEVDSHVAFPLGHLRDLAREGVIGECAPSAYSFVGAASQLRLRDRIAAEWAQLLRDDDVDLVLLVPV